jgi:hypothetical protein
MRAERSVQRATDVSINARHMSTLRQLFFFFFFLIIIADVDFASVDDLKTGLTHDGEEVRSDWFIG